MEATELYRNPAEVEFIRATKPQRIRNILLKQIGRPVIDISDNYIGDDGLIVAFEFLTEHNCMPEKLYLRGNKLTGKCLESLANYLVQHDSIKYLSIEWNECNDPTALSQLVSCIGSMNIVILNMKSNKIDQQCDEALVQLIGNQSALLEVDLSWNELTNASAKKLIEALKANKRIVSLGLRGNGISQAFHDQIEQICESNLNQQPRVIDLLAKLRAEDKFVDTVTPVNESGVEVKNAVRENLVEYLKEDLTAEKNVNKDLAEKIQLLTANENSFKNKTAELQRNNETLTLDNERLLLENQQLKNNVDELNANYGAKVNNLEGQIKSLKTALENKEQEYTLKFEKYVKENKQKLSDTIKQWESR